MRKERYAHYKRLCEEFEVLQRRPWDTHYQELRARRQLMETLADTARTLRAPQMTPEQRALVGAEFCTYCQEDCLPLPPHGICGFCSRIPATGEFAGSESQIEEQRRRWRQNTRAYRERKKEEAA